MVFVLKFRKLEQIILLLLICVIGNGQTILKFEADFTIIQKNKIANKSTIFKGQVSSNISEKISKYSLTFPNKETWILRDSTLALHKNDSLLKTFNVHQFENFSIINDLNAAFKKDYGLSELGFHQENVTQDSTKVFIKWLPPTALKDIFGSAVTCISDNLLHSVTLIDPLGNIASTVFFSNYTFFKNYPIPLKITSKIVGDKETIFKSIVFSNVKINNGS